MSNLRLLVPRTVKVLGLCKSARDNAAITVRAYASIPSTYLKPVFQKPEQEKLMEAGAAAQLAHEKIRPALITDTSSEFYDPVVTKFINYLMKNGDRKLARQIVDDAFVHIKRIQLKKYHSSPPEEQDKIELDPKVLLRKAIANATPILELVTRKRGGIGYRIPTPITEKRATRLAQYWIIQFANEKDNKVNFEKSLAQEIVDTAENVGRVIRKKRELHKQCEANRAYAHFRWQ